MAEYDVYQEIAQRTGGSVYIGVVGPVRTGKSTLIRRFMDLLVVPELKDEWYRERLVDELPQSGAGRTIMTTQISFVPGEPLEVELSDKTKCSIRMVDCVGFMVDGALGDSEDGLPRMVRTPWQEEEMPFKTAAEVGTRKVIRDHATIGLVVTTDGTITDLPRDSYVSAEEKTIQELKELGKPFAIVLNSRTPDSPAAQRLQEELEGRYDVPVVPMDVLHMEREDVGEILETVLFEFPVRQVDIQLDEWLQALPDSHWLVTSLMDNLRDSADEMTRLRDYQDFAQKLSTCEYIDGLDMDNIYPGTGSLQAQLKLPRSLYYRVLSEESGIKVEDEAQLMSLMYDLAASKREFDRMSQAWREVKETGYGLIKPTMEEMDLEEPEIVKTGGRFGVRLKARAPSFHLIRVDLDTEISPFVGTEKQSQELVSYLLEAFEENRAGIWKTEMFGKPMSELVRENLAHKLVSMPEDARRKTRTALSRVINDGKENLFFLTF